LQSLNVVLTFIGAYLGHHHHGREFPATVRRLQTVPSAADKQVHGLMAKILVFFIIVVSVSERCGPR